MNKTTKKRTKAYISFDFDWTLYNPETDSIIKETKDIMDKYIKSGYNICITTLRAENDIKRIKELFPEITTYPTGGFNKTVALKKYIPVPILKHYDDDLNTCISLKRWTRIVPVWVRNKKMLEEMNDIEHIDLP